MRQWLTSGASRFLLSCTVITAIGLAIGAGGPVLLAQLSHPAQAQNVLVLPEAAPDKPAVIPEPITLPAPKQSALPPPAKLIAVPGFAEPLVATGAGTVADDAALQAALSAFRAPASKSNDFAEAAKPLEAYLAAHPGSPWTLALQTNLGKGYYQSGYYSRALSAWQQAWDAGKGATTPEAKRLADRALGELARMQARIGRVKDIDPLLAQASSRSIEGAATEYLAGAREGAWMMRNQPGEAFLCGPRALGNVLAAQGAAREQVKVAFDAKSGPNGVSLTELSALATKAGLGHQIIKRAPGQAIPVPSVVHWSLDHYAAIVAVEDGRYRVKDPTFASGEQLLTAAAIEAESSGYFLVPQGAQRSTPTTTGKAAATAVATTDWRTVEAAADEAKAVYGRGYAIGTDDNNGFSCPLSTTAKPTGSKARAASQMCGSAPNMNLAAITIADTPVGYGAAKGYDTAVKLAYNQREALQPANFTFTNIGQKWSLNWLSWIQDGPTDIGNSVTRYVGGGGGISQYGYSGDTFAPGHLNGAGMQRAPAGDHPNPPGGL